eukprot:6101804-Amphidinium_carterae.1
MHVSDQTLLQLELLIATQTSNSVTVEEVSQLQEKVASLREKKRELAKKAVSDQACCSHKVSGRMVPNVLQA